jgi:hypothetical protein
VEIRGTLRHEDVPLQLRPAIEPVFARQSKLGISEHGGVRSGLNGDIGLVRADARTRDRIVSAIGGEQFLCALAELLE